MPLKISLFSQGPAEGELVLSDNGKPIVLDAETGRDSIHVKLQPGKNALVHRVRMNPDGPEFHRFEVQFVPSRKQDDTISQNNVASAFTVVSGKGKVLLVSTSREDDEKFEQALKEENIDVEVVDADKIPTQLEEYQPYSAVVLSNVPADLVPRPLQESLASYVKDLGGGLIMMGGHEVVRRRRLDRLAGRGGHAGRLRDQGQAADAARGPGDGDAQLRDAQRQRLGHPDRPGGRRRGRPAWTTSA